MNAPKPLRFTRADYHRIGEAGVLPAAARVELIFGEIIEMSPKGVAHEACLRTLLRQLFSLVDQNYTIGCQSPITIGDSSEPEPDVSIAFGSESTFESRHPVGHEVLLAIEIADSTLHFDKTTKAALYAEAQIANYWIFNLINHCVESRRQPERKVDGSWHYAKAQIYSAIDQLPLPLSHSKSTLEVVLDLSKIAL